MPRGLNDFAGEWSITRVIEDRLGVPGRFSGTASLIPDEARLLYKETGTLVLGTAPAMQAERQYIWHATGPLIQVLFDDGRPFHRFDPNADGAGERHHCAPDVYDVTYNFGDWPQWSSQWTVTGPRKNYVMRTAYALLDKDAA